MKEIQPTEGELKVLSHSFRKVEFFSTLSVAEMERIFTYIKLFSFDPGEVVFKQGGPGDALFILSEGVLTVIKKRWMFGSQVLGELKAGDFFGEMALLDKKPRSATVKVAERAKIFRLLTSDFDRVVTKNSLFLHEIHTVADVRKQQNQTLR